MTVLNVITIGIKATLTPAMRRAYKLSEPDTVSNGSALGYLSGTFPNGLTLLEGSPVSARVRVHYRAASYGAILDGHMVAEVQSGVDGTWVITGLDPSKKYDVVGRLEGKNDVIMSNVSPAVY